LTFHDKAALSRVAPQLGAYPQDVGAQVPWYGDLDPCGEASLRSLTQPTQ
jgi:hypothetical protein